MLTPALRQTIVCLYQSGKSGRTIAKLLNVSRNTIKKVLQQGVELPVATKEASESEITPILRAVFGRCLGNAVRVQEVLKEEYQLSIAYSTLTRLIQNTQLREPMQRVGDYDLKPGEEMQHDTSPHWVVLGEKKVKAQCACLVLAYSRKLFIQYYPCFTRFEAKSFLKAALEWMQGVCRRCVIDNTSVILAAGSGADAVVSPEMRTFCRMFGFEFMAHRIDHPDRKGRVERPFYYVETNFLAGRTFKDWSDLNGQAKQWCLERDKKEKRILGMTPEAAFIQERPYLIQLPEVLPPIYEHVQRIVDSKGFVNLDTNRYSVPERLIGKTLDVYKYSEEVQVFHQRQAVATHVRLAGKRNAVTRLAGHHSKHHMQQTHQATIKTEAMLRGQEAVLDLYVGGLKKQVRGSGHRALNRLLHLKRTYPPAAFLQAVQKAQHYGLYDLSRLEQLIIKCVAGNYFNVEGESL